MADAAAPPCALLCGNPWDCLPWAFPGGAPINVAYHLQKLGLTAYPLLLSAQIFLGRNWFDDWSNGVWIPVL
jgi:hypothetical protein